MNKYFFILTFLLFSQIALPKSLKQKNTTAYSMCNRIVERKTQAIIVAIETLTEKGCLSLGRAKASQYQNSGWECRGLNNEELFSCENKKPISFAIYKGIKLDHLTFTNLQKRRSLLAYINPNSNELCHEDRDDLIAGGVTDAICHKRQNK